MNQEKKRILVVGGGFTGLLAARRSAKNKNVHVTLLDTSTEFLFAPRLIDALKNTSFPRDRYLASYETMAKRDGFTFVNGEALAIHRAEKFVTYQSFTRQEPDTLAYDALLYCPGARTRFFNTPGAKEFSYPLKSIPDLERLRTKIHSILEQAREATTDLEKRRLLSFVMVGAGPSGVESIFAIRSLVRAWCKNHAPGLDDLSSYAIAQAGPQILHGFPTKLVHGVMKVLADERITVYLGESVTTVERDQITTSLRRVIPASVIIWTAGVEPVIVKSEPEIHTDNAGVIVDHSLHIDASHLAGGDASSYREHNVLIPKNAQTAMHMARIATSNLVKSAHEQTPSFYRYLSLGNLLVVGDVGFLEFRGIVVRSQFVPFLRDLLYRFRMWQMTRG